MSLLKKATIDYLLLGTLVGCDGGISGSNHMRIPGVTAEGLPTGDYVRGIVRYQPFFEGSNKTLLTFVYQHEAVRMVSLMDINSDGDVADSVDRIVVYWSNGESLSFHGTGEVDTKHTTVRAPRQDYTDQWGAEYKTFLGN